MPSIPMALIEALTADEVPWIRKLQSKALQLDKTWVGRQREEDPNLRFWVKEVFDIVKKLKRIQTLTPAEQEAAEHNESSQECKKNEQETTWKLEA
ncbi:hypothetical protein Tco_0054112 [Tanacetum coccineum]